MKKILITGVAGFLGSNLAKKYLALGHVVIGVDNLLTTFDTKNIDELFSNKNFSFHKHDIIEKKDFGRIDWIFNAACCGSPSSYQFNPIHTIKTNFDGVTNMLELAKKYDARIMQFSTSEVYGDPEVSPQPETYKGSVSTLGPRACYDEGKRLSETLCMDYYREFGVDVKIIRIFNTYGPGMDPNDGRAVTNFINQALENRDITIYGTGLNTRSFQYVDDLLDGIDKMMYKENFVGPVNLGNSKEFTVNDLVKKVIELTDSKSKIIFQEEASDDPKHRCPNISLAKRELDWIPKISLEQGLPQTINYFKNLKTPSKNILVFTTTFIPIVGPAEQSFIEIAKNLPNINFHIVTAKLKRDLASFEKLENLFIHRIGFGLDLDKYLLPFFGYCVSKKIILDNKIRFAWSIMPSYGLVLARLIKKQDLNILVTLDHVGNRKRNYIRSKITDILANLMLKKVDSIIVSDINNEKKTKIKIDTSKLKNLGVGSNQMAETLRHMFVELLNKQEKKLHRYK